MEVMKIILRFMSVTMSSPRVWRRFSRNINGKEITFRIQEIGPENYENMLRLYLDYYTPEEPITKTAGKYGVFKSDEAIEEYKKHYLRPCVSEECQIDACCVDNDSGSLEIIAGSIMYIDEKSHPWDGKDIIPLLKTEPTKKFFKMAVYMADVFYKDFRYKLPDTHEFYDDVGIVVHKDYRGLGIAGELFKAREIVCKEHGVPAVGAWMTSIASQKAASKLGWETVLELTYEDIGKIGNVSYNEPVPSAKYMTKNVSNN